jgi:hypothetical protein
VVVILEPSSGDAKSYLDRAKLEVERVLAFRGSLSCVNVKGKKTMVKFEVNPKWDLPMAEKVNYLKEWIPAKVKVVFKVISVSEEEHA